MELGITPEQLQSFGGLKPLDIVLILLAVYLVFRLLSNGTRAHPFLFLRDPGPFHSLGISSTSQRAQRVLTGQSTKLYTDPSAQSEHLVQRSLLLTTEKLLLICWRGLLSNQIDLGLLTADKCEIGFERWVTTLKSYNDEFRLHRKLFHNFIGTRFAMTKFEKLEEIETRRFLLRVFNDPDNFMDYIRALPGTLILKMAYGYTTNPEGSDPLVNLADEVVGDIFSKTCVFGKWTVDVLPFVRHLPEWLPGMVFKSKARVWSETVASFCNKPYAFVKHQMAVGKASNSFVYENIENGTVEKLGEDIVKHVAASLYGGGADTTVSAIGTFYLAMLLYPDVMRRAQEEIDRAVGHDRLPSLSDRRSLLYIDALVKETLRWENVVELDVPHKVMEDDTYMGYSIPKGSLVLANIWQMTHDSEDYYEPLEFKPERFLGDSGVSIAPDPRTMVFGFGRRICPGKELADSSLFIAIAMSAAAFDITKANDKFGNDIELRQEYVSGIIRHPKPFRCQIKPRSQKAVALIQSILDEYPLEGGDGDIIESL